MKMRLSENKICTSQREKGKLVHTYALTNADKIKNSSARELLQIRHINVLRGNFSAVDLGEEPCHNSLSEKGKYGGRGK